MLAQVHFSIISKFSDVGPQFFAIFMFVIFSPESNYKKFWEKLMIQCFKLLSLYGEAKKTCTQITITLSGLCSSMISIVHIPNTGM